MYERFTDRARKVLQLANEEARRFGQECVGTEHILLGLVKEGRGVAAYALRNLGVEPDAIVLEIEKLVPSPLDVTVPKKHPAILRIIDRLRQLLFPRATIPKRLPQTPRAKKVIEYAMEEARALGHDYVGTEHILLGLTREDEGVAAQVLMNLGLNLSTLRREIEAILRPPSETQ